MDSNTTFVVPELTRYRSSTSVVPVEVRRARVQPANNFLAIHRASLARCGAVNLGPRDGAVEQHHKSASRRFRILHSRRRRPLAETLREPLLADREQWRAPGAPHR